MKIWFTIVLCDFYTYRYLKGHFAIYLRDESFHEKLIFLSFFSNFFFFRPSFKYFSWHTSLVGLIGTSVMMFFISPLFAAVAILLCLSLILALNFFSPARHANWGSISQALIFHQVRILGAFTYFYFRPLGPPPTLSISTSNKSIHENNLQNLEISF